MKQFLLLYLTLFSFSIAFPQQEYPKTDFIPPLDIPLILAGNFGELRSNHYHSGIDIKTQQREGLKVYSVADGYVSRIKISHYGYGKAIYITHPNSYTTVYAHLSKFNGTIQDYILKKQYEEESFEIELFPAAAELPVTQGDIIAFSGNTGGSGGPHLHFEVRDTQTEHVLNPLLFGFEVKDTNAPVLTNVLGYTFGSNSQINGQQGTVQVNYSKQNDGSYMANTIYALGDIAFGCDSYDRQDGAINKNGVYGMTVKVNGATYLDLDFETFSFDESRQINTYIDYSRFAISGRRYVKTFIDKGNELSIYNANNNNGIITVENGKDYTVTVSLKDIEDNTTTLYIPVKGKDVMITKPEEKQVTDYYLLANRDNFYELNNASLFIPANTFYDNIYLDLKTEDDAIIVHNKEVPLRDYYSISFDVSNFKDSLNLSQYFIANYNYRGYPIYENTRLKGDIMSTRTRDLGKFKLLKDTKAPTVYANNFNNKQWLSRYHYLTFRISDDLSGIKSYRATIDGKWILTEYDYKTNSLTFNFEDLDFEGSEHNLELIVTDNVGNSTTFKRTFFRKYKP